jgi:hypothetical protein
VDLLRFSSYNSKLQCRYGILTKLGFRLSDPIPTTVYDNCLPSNKGSIIARQKQNRTRNIKSSHFRNLQQYVPACRSCHSFSSSRAAAHIPTFLSKRINSIRSAGLNTAMVSSMSTACFWKARSIKSRPALVS